MFISEGTMVTVWQHERANIMNVLLNRVVVITFGIGFSTVFEEYTLIYTDLIVFSYRSTKFLAKADRSK